MTVMKVDPARAEDLRVLRKQLDDAKVAFGALADKTRAEMGSNSSSVHPALMRLGKFDRSFEYLIIDEEGR